MINPTPAALGASSHDPAQSLFPGVEMRAADLHAAAKKCRELAQEIREQAKQMAAANEVAAASNPFAALTLGTNSVCGGMGTAMENMAEFHDNHAAELDRAAILQRKSDEDGEAGFLAVG